MPRGDTPTVSVGIVSARPRLPPRGAPEPPPTGWCYITLFPVAAVHGGRGSDHQGNRGQPQRLHGAPALAQCRGWQRRERQRPRWQTRRWPLPSRLAAALGLTDPKSKGPHCRRRRGYQLPPTTGRKHVPRGTRPYPEGAKPTAGSPPAGAENAARHRPPRLTKTPRVRDTVKTTRGWRIHDGIRSRRSAPLLACGAPSGVPSVAPPASLPSRRPARFSGPASRVIQPARRRLPPREALSFGNPPSPASAGAKSCAAPGHCPTRRQPARSAAPHSFGAHRGTRRQPGRRPTGASPTTVPIGHRCSASPVIRRTRRPPANAAAPGRPKPNLVNASGRSSAPQAHRPTRRQPAPKAAPHRRSAKLVACHYQGQRPTGSPPLHSPPAGNKGHAPLAQRRPRRPRARRAATGTAWARGSRLTHLLPTVAPPPMATLHRSQQPPCRKRAPPYGRHAHRPGWHRDGVGAPPRR